MFLAEVLSLSIQEEESNELLFDYLENAFLWFDSHDKFSHFHLLFLVNLTKFLGFYPDTSNIKKEGFHLREGIFTDAVHDKEIYKGDEVFQLKKLLGINFDAIESIKFSKTQRRGFLRMLIRYFELHLDGFKNPKSLSVLEAVFSR
jgi:DNA repair protein RecO (recombination protein O)